MNGHIQLSVKYYEHGLGSNFLNNFKIGDTFKARLIENAHFHLPKKASKVIMIANGTGVAPFLGMLDQNHKKKTIDLYLGLRTAHSFELYKKDIETLLESKKLQYLKLALSQEDERIYVQHLIEKEGQNIAETLENNGKIMICGSLAMYKDVMETLNLVCLKFNKKPLSDYAKHIKSDCY